MADTPPLVAFRCDASLQIGSGHLMRCLTLAEQLTASGASCVFLCAAITPPLADCIVAEGHRLLRLGEAPDSRPDSSYFHSYWLPHSQDADARLSREALAAAGIAPSHLVLDHYALAAPWCRSLKEAFPSLRRLVVDDLADRTHDCELLLDQTALREESDYRTLVPPACLLLCGGDFALLRSGFAELRRAPPPKASPPRLLLSLGGMDPEGFSPRLAAWILDGAAEWCVDVALTSSSPAVPALRELASLHPQRFELHLDTREMPALMARAALALGAGGATAWERCCLGLPTLALQVAENQSFVLAALGRARAAILLGPATSLRREDLLQALSQAAVQLPRLAAAAAGLVDGQGAGRAASLFLGQAGAVLRPCVPEDCRRLFDWQCLPETRRFARNPEPPSWEGHSAWFAAALASPLRRLYFLVDAASGAELGFLRLDGPPAAGPCEVSILLDPAAKGRGYGLASLRLLRMAAPRAAFDAYIQEANAASRALFAKAGYQPLQERPGWHRLSP